MAKPLPVQPPPPPPRPETFRKQIEILRDIGASQRTIRIVEAAAKKASGQR